MRLLRGRVGGSGASQLLLERVVEVVASCFSRAVARGFSRVLRDLGFLCSSDVVFVMLDGFL